MDVEIQLNEGKKFNAFLNSYDNSKNYLEQYNLYYNPKKYFQLEGEMQKLRVNMDKGNREFNSILDSHLQPITEKAAENKHKMTSTSMSYLPDVDRSLHDYLSLNFVNETAMFRDK